MVNSDSKAVGSSFENRLGNPASINIKYRSVIQSTELKSKNAKIVLVFPFFNEFASVFRG